MNKEWDDIEIRKHIEVIAIPGGVRIHVSKLVKALTQKDEELKKKIEELDIEDVENPFSLGECMHASISGHNTANEKWREKIKELLSVDKL